MKTASIPCSHCQRTAAEIRGAIESKGYVSHRTVSSILFLDHELHTCCGRCIAEHDLVLLNSGNAIVQNRTKDGVWLVNERLLAKANTEPVVDFLDAPMTQREVEYSIA